MNCPHCHASVPDDVKFCLNCGRSLDEATMVYQQNTPPPPPPTESQGMTKNQKIALGCGGGGCLLLILAAVVVVFGYLSYARRTPNSNYNYNTNYNANRNANANSYSTNANTSSESDTYTEDQHRLYQAAAAGGDSDMIKRVHRKLGLLNSSDNVNDKYSGFIKEHISWIFANTEWIRTNIGTKEKAQAYAEEHIDD